MSPPLLEPRRPDPPPRGLRAFLPILGWLPAYDRRLFRGDAVAGLTTAVMLVPQAMAYAMLAGLPPIVGLYASAVPLSLYALFGTSRQLSVGPVALDSLLTLQGISLLAEPNTASYVAYAVALSALVGALQIAMGALRLGFLVNFLSQPVISGFTSAAALIIGASQLGPLLGVELGGGGNVAGTFADAWAKRSSVHGETLALGALAVTALLVARRRARRFPAALAVVAVGSLAVLAFGLEARGVRVVGEVPSGFPTPGLPVLELSAAKALLPTALTIALVGFLESISVAKAFARKHRYEVAPNQELLGVGAANLGSSLFGGYPVAGGFSRTAVNAEAGARTGMASIVTAAVVAATLLFLTPLFRHLPLTVLAAIILTAAVGLVDGKEVRRLYRVERVDLGLLIATFVGTLALGVQLGLLAGVGASLFVFVVRTTRPHVAVLGRVPGTEEYRNVKNYPEAIRTPGVLALRIDAQLYFGNVSFLRETLRRLELEMDEPLSAVVLDATSVNQLDSSAEDALADVLSTYRERGVAFVVAGVKWPIRRVMERSGLWEALGPEGHALRVHDAVTRVS